jgi:hypothetical protein
MARSEHHPRLTPLRALALLRKVGDAGVEPSKWLLEDVKTALEHHVANALTSRRRRRGRGR